MMPQKRHVTLTRASVAQTKIKTYPFFVSTKVQPLSIIFYNGRYSKARDKGRTYQAYLSLRSVSRGQVPPVALLPHKGFIGITLSLMKFGDGGFSRKLDKDQLKTLRGTIPQLAARLCPGHLASEIY